MKKKKLLGSTIVFLLIAGSVGFQNCSSGFHSVTGSSTSSQTQGGHNTGSVTPAVPIDSTPGQVQAPAPGAPPQIANWAPANLTYFESYPDPGSEECLKYNGCTWAG